MNFGCALDLAAQDHRREEEARDLPGGIDPFLAVEGPLAGGALAPTFGPVRVADADEHDAALDGAPEARLEEVYEAQAYLVQLDQADVHAGQDSEVRMMPESLARVV